ncbi:MAG: (2Fe-2S)-binding protein [Xanthobacteraceae bacterium]|nr:(2Fe-2S)-binding protein [Xanthobacteraceae bacterium]
MNDEETIPLRCTVNGEPVHAVVPVRKSLVDWLRQDLALTGSHVGCEHGVCGACGVVVDGRVVRGCLMLAVEADGLAIETIEGATRSGRVAALQKAFVERAALQCGFCTSAMILQAAEFLAANASPSRDEVRHAISGNYCRCTGYEAIVDAIVAAGNAGAG